VRSDPRYLTNEQIISFAAMVGAESTETQPTTEVVLPEEEAEDEGGPNWLLLGLICLGLFFAAAAVVYFLVIRSGKAQDTRPEVLDRRDSLESDLGYEEDVLPYEPSIEEDFEAPLQEEKIMPVAQFMTTYMVGDDLYDDSFSIDAPTGEFLGECGLGISETVGVGEPKRVTAFEIWLFDKNDIQTVTKVIMSAHAHEDEKIRLRLESKGEPILAEPGKQILLETATLQLEARIVDMEYGEGAAPDHSFFQRMTLELAIWPK
jgi:hypothetical protein